MSETDGSTVEVAQKRAWAAGIVNILIKEDGPVECTDCRNELDVTDCETEEKVLEEMEQHRRKHHV